MKKYFSHLAFGGAGTDSAVVFEAENDKEAMHTARDYAVDNAAAYGYYQDLEYFGDLDQVGKESEDYDEEDEDEERYEDTGFLEYNPVPYVAEEHDGYV